MSCVAWLMAAALAIMSAGPAAMFIIDGDPAGLVGGLMIARMAAWVLLAWDRWLDRECGL